MTTFTTFTVSCFLQRTPTFFNYMQIVTKEMREQAIFDLGEFYAREMVRVANATGYKLGEGITRWTLVKDYRHLTPLLRDDDWILDIKAPIVEWPEESEQS